jgi:transposase
MHYELTEYEWTAIKPMLPSKPRGVPRVNDRRVLNGILWVLRSGAPWRNLPESYGSPTTCYNRFVRWQQAGVWDRLAIRLRVQQRSSVSLAELANDRAAADGEDHGRAGLDHGGGLCGHDIGAEI